MIKRPGRAETEEELLKFQEEFFASKQEPSVTIKKTVGDSEISKTNRDIVVLKDSDIQADISALTNDNPLTKKSGKRFRINEDDFDAARQLDEKDKDHISSILTNIQEHNVSSTGQFHADFYKTGFPLVPSLDRKSLKDDTPVKKKSLFAQQFKSFSESGALGNITVNKIQKDIVESSDDAEMLKETLLKYPSRSCLLGKDWENIHEENLNLLKEMSDTTITEERQKLLDSLDPNIVSFLQSKAKTASTSQSLDIEKVDSNLTDVSNTEYKKAVKTKLQQKNTDKSFKVDTNPKSIIDAGPILNETDIIDPYEEFNIKKDFVHMTKEYVEKEKLAWMKDVPKVNLTESGHLPRFDFEGCLLKPEEEIPMNVGLHHHGDEPGMAGYTLEELFQMARSNFPKQRVFSLQSLGRIIEKYHQRYYDGKLSANLLTQCLDAGLLFILRWSLDEHAEQIYSAAAAALAYIVYVQADQEIVDKMLFTCDGLKLPSLCTYYKKKKEKMSQEELEEDRDLTDAEMIRCDVIKGLLQIQILPRLRYVMEACQPSDAAIRNCFKILIRIVQHNKDCAFEVFKDTSLLKVVMKIVNVKNSESLACGLKLVKYICSVGKNMASKLLSSYNLAQLITTNLSSMDTRDEVFVEVCMIWRILLSYNISTDLVRDFYPMTMAHLQYAVGRFKESNDERLAAIIHVVSSIIKASLNKEIDWSIVDGLQQVVFHALKASQQEMLEMKKITHPLYTDAVLQCCSSYFITKNSMVSQVNPVDLLEEVEEFWKDRVQVILESSLLNQLLDELRVYSDFRAVKCEIAVLKPTTMENLPSYGTFCIDDCCPPSMKPESSISLVNSLFFLIIELMNTNKKLVPKVLSMVVAPEILSYLKFINESKVLSGCFVGFSTYGLDVLNLYQEVAVKVLSLIQPGDEPIVLQMMRNIIFNPDVFRMQNYTLWVSEYYDGNVNAVLKKMLNIGRKDLRSIADMYITVLFGSKFEAIVETDSYMTPSRKTSCIPQDWMFYPLIELYDISLRIEQSGGIIQKANDQTIHNTRKCLQFLLLVETTRPALLVNIDETLRLTRFLCVFLTEGELYKETLLTDLVISLTSIYSSPTFQCYLDFEKKIPGITSFYDLFSNLLQQYLAASYGDHTFANLLLIPMALTYDVKYRRAVWTEYDDLLRLFPVPLNKISCDIKRFLAARSEDEEMIELYHAALIKGKVRPTWCPIFYLIAVHHVNQFIFSTDESSDDSDANTIDKTTKQKKKRQMLTQLQSFSSCNVKDDVISYKCFDIHSENGFSKFKVLPPSRELLLRNIQQDRS